MKFIKKTSVKLMILTIFMSCTSPASEKFDNSESLRNRADDFGIIIGAAVEQSHLSELKYSETLKTQFNCVISENNMKFSFMQPNEGSFSFENSDNLVDYAIENDMKVRGHVFLWHSDYQIPDWVKNKQYSQLKGVIENHVSGGMRHFNDKIYAWDVANEIVLDSGAGLRNRTLSGGDYSVWASSLYDDSVIRSAFYKADSVRKEIGDDVGLYLCDYSNETKGQPKSDKFYEIVEDWVNDGVPIDGVGFQMHLMEKYTPDYINIKAQIDRFQNLGLDVQFTEIDVRIEEPFTRTKLLNQAEIYAQILRIAKEKNIKSYLVWGVTDKYSWIPSTFNGYGSGLLFDEEYQAKPAYFELLEELK